MPLSKTYLTCIAGLTALRPLLSITDTSGRKARKVVRVDMLDMPMHGPLGGGQSLKGRPAGNRSVSHADKKSPFQLNQMTASIKKSPTSMRVCGRFTSS